MLGMHWLRTLGPMLWDFSTWTMNFTLAKKFVTHKGLSPKHSDWVEEGDLSQLTKVERRGMLLQIIEVGPKQGPEQEESPALAKSEEVLHKNNMVFDDPKGLPPKRSHDHHITLNEGIGPISARPYRYPFYKNLK